MKIILRFSILFLTFGLFGATDFRLDYRYTEEVDGWVKFHLLPATWNNAMVRCHLEGAMLASPTTRDLMSTMLQGAIFHGNPMSLKLFTGLNDKLARGSYFTIYGIPLDDIAFTWADNEPDNYKNSESCLVLNPDGTMSDTSCEDVHPYMCYKKRRQDMPAMTDCGTTDPEYHFESETSSCYKYHHVARHWSRAFEACAAEGGGLAIVNSVDEARLLKNIFFRDPTHTGTNIHKKMVLLGFRYNEDLGHWLTIRGETLDEAGYAIWESGEPNNFTSPDQKGEGEYCGSMDMSKQYLGLNDLWCGYVNPFICEKDPKRIVGEPKADYEERIRNLAVEEQTVQREESTTVTAEDTTLWSLYYRIPDYTPSNSVYEFRNIEDGSGQLNPPSYTEAENIDVSTKPEKDYKDVVSTPATPQAESSPNQEETTVIPEDTETRRAGLTTFGNLNHEPNSLDEELQNIEVSSDHIHEAYTPLPYTTYRPSPIRTEPVSSEELKKTEASSEYAPEAYTPLPFTTYRPSPTEDIMPDELYVEKILSSLSSPPESGIDSQGFDVKVQG